MPTTRRTASSPILRKGKEGEPVLVVLNFTPVPRDNYRIGVPAAGRWREILNSDAACYGGMNQGNMGCVDAEPIPLHGRPCSLTLTLPALGAVFFQRGAAPEAPAQPAEPEEAATPEVAEAENDLSELRSPGSA